MSLATAMVDARVTFVERPFARPLRLSSGLITRITEATASVTVRIAGRETTGRGAIYLSDLWAWPDPAIAHEQRDAALRDLCMTIAGRLGELAGGEPAHPLELGLRLHESVCHRLEAPVPSILARAMCLSPFDAAIHDAAGLALERSAFDLYDSPAPLPSADRFFDSPGSAGGKAGGGACAAIARGLKRPPRRELDAWLVVGKDDDLESDLAPWVRGRGYRCFKLKVMGQDAAADAARTAAVFRAARGLGVAAPRLSLDSNEANPDAASVLDYLHRLRTLDAEAFAALAYLEQPTGRDIRAHRHDWRAVAALKPVLLDEGLTDLSLLEEAAGQGWSGLALKTCKGHSFALAAAAWALRRGLALSVQDLTNPGLAGIHAALLAAHLPTLNGVELNSPQFTPDANAAWLPRLAGLFEVRGGVHRLPWLPERALLGLGSDW